MPIVRRQIRDETLFFLNDLADWRLPVELHYAYNSGQPGAAIANLTT